MPEPGGKKAIVYHYVRPGAPGWDDLKYLHLDNFRRQLDWLARNGGFLSREQFRDAIENGEPADGAILTFDDGFADHYFHVFPELQSRGLWGLFFVPTGIYTNGRLLDVHRIHLIVARCGGTASLAAAKEVVTDDMLAHADSVEFNAATYARFNDNADTIAFKRMFNDFIANEHRQEALDRVVVRLALRLPEARDFYISPGHIKEMADAGMVIGSHTVNHPVMSKIDRHRQRQEIETSFGFLSNVVGAPVESFCYPYGGFHSFTGETETLLSEAGCRYAFNVEPRDICADDLRSRPQALPRYDCNHFPFGKAGPV